MDVVIGILVVAALGYGALMLVQSRAKKRAELEARAEKRAKAARADQLAIQRSIDGRR